MSEYRAAMRQLAMTYPVQHGVLSGLVFCGIFTLLFDLAAMFGLPFTRSIAGMLAGALASGAMTTWSARPDKGKPTPPAL